MTPHPIVGYDPGSRHMFFICPRCQARYHYFIQMAPANRQPVQSRCVKCKVVFTGTIRTRTEIKERTDTERKKRGDPDDK
jgi:hypothetical protein